MYHIFAMHFVLVASWELYLCFNGSKLPRFRIIDEKIGRSFESEEVVRDTEIWYHYGFLSNSAR